MGRSFTGRVALVTGAARGLGLACARALSRHGATVVLADVDAEAARASAATLDPPALGVAMDVADAESVATALRRVTAELGSVSLLVNNAGICTNEAFAELAYDTWRRVFDVNVHGAFLCMQAVVPEMIAAGAGSIVNIGSLAGRNGGITVSAAYSASKAAVAGLTKAAAKQLAPNGIRVNCVAPGPLETDMTADWPPENLEKLRSSTPLGRLGVPDDVAEAVAFLLSDDAAHVTGVTLDVNGGIFVAP
jgi:NAD(P)-dependent dehydrogenase (short-subunit alcohol dehydrogenase family)